MPDILGNWDRRADNPYYVGDNTYGMPIYRCPENCGWEGISLENHKEKCVKISKPILLQPEEVNHILACADYLAALAKKWVQVHPFGQLDGDQQDVADSLADVYKLLGVDKPKTE